MSIQHDEQGYVIIGEAALSLALGRKEVSVSSLISVLKDMAAVEKNDDRVLEIFEACRWLGGFLDTEGAIDKVPYLQAFADLNEVKN